MAGIVGIRAEDMEQVDALKRARLDWPQGLPMIRPSVKAPVLMKVGDTMVAQPARFGFNPRFPSFNARDDKLRVSPLWRGHFGKNHGIFAFSYVIEWMERPDGTKQPYLIQRRDGKLILAPALIGHHHEHKDEFAFAICTREPNRFFARFHARMTGVCTPALMERWLSPSESTPEKLMECIRAPDDDELVAIPSSPAIQKRKTGDWSALPVTGPPIGIDDPMPP